MMPAPRHLDLTPHYQPEPRWQGFLIAVALYSLGIVAALGWTRWRHEREVTEVSAAVARPVEERAVRMVYIPPKPAPAAAPKPPAPRAPSAAPRATPPANPGEDSRDPLADPIRAIRAPEADPGGDAERLGESNSRAPAKIAPPKASAIALGPLTSEPPAPAPEPVAEPTRATFGGPSIGPRLGIPPRDPRPWTRSFPSKGDSCATIPTDPDHPGQPRMGSASGRVLRVDNGFPLANAHLQIIGTTFVTYTDRNGEYTLTFNASLLDRCRTQYVRVSAEGFEPRLLVLLIGHNVRSDDVALRKH